MNVVLEQLRRKYGLPKDVLRLIIHQFRPKFPVGLLPDIHVSRCPEMIFQGTVFIDFVTETHTVCVYKSLNDRYWREKYIRRKDLQLACNLCLKVVDRSVRSPNFNIFLCSAKCLAAYPSLHNY